ncbi:MAG: hypothetical protein HOA15_05970 [Candidatus Marinimicrobia bacterium]|nr:hypothetical protein [Candidatus Neomarinimicrobiota bacterium]MBT4809103.1 hypothetical protein [Candidatus Neomarinimicrobiota bacterium]MBT5176385.1 hypothetical protein [Candidatus Neomarinimicrobiota bacterium]MBT6130366.1 hypothetical protein [Candidatus Neomarinimicrobiota bacterium]MBT6841433.1 hypothetical protein [Candidatus Neomarinimicrobiota bacterium]
MNKNTPKKQSHLCVQFSARQKTLPKKGLPSIYAREIFIKSVFRITLFVGVISCISAQPKLSFYLGGGFYNPGLVGLDPDSNDVIPSMNLFNRNILMDWGVKYQFYPNARIGYSQSHSFHTGTIGESNFSRSLTYRVLSIETFFFPREKLELNFTLAPMLNKGTIELTASATSKDWDDFLKNLDKDNENVSLVIGGIMSKNWFGFSSMVGARYYLTAAMSIEGRLGYYKNFYNSKNWELEKSKVLGPKMAIDKMPVFQLFYVFGF